MSKEAPAANKEQPQPSKVRVGKRPVDKAIGDRWPKKRIRVSGHPDSPFMSKRNKVAVENNDEEKA